MAIKHSVVAALAALSIALPTAGFGQPAGAPDNASNDATRQVVARFSGLAERVLQLETPTTVQDELVTVSALLMQDALAEQRMHADEVAADKARIAEILCQESETVCADVRKDLDVIAALYGSAAVDKREYNAAVTGLMSEVVAWVDKHPAEAPAR